MRTEAEVSRNGLRRLRFGVNHIADPGHFLADLIGEYRLADIDGLFGVNP